MLTLTWLDFRKFFIFFCSFWISELNSLQVTPLTQWEQLFFSLGPLGLHTKVKKKEEIFLYFRACSLSDHLQDLLNSFSLTSMLTTLVHLFSELQGFWLLISLFNFRGWFLVPVAALFFLTPVPSVTFTRKAVWKASILPSWTSSMTDVEQKGRWLCYACTHFEWHCPLLSDIKWLQCWQVSSRFCSYSAIITAVKHNLCF